MPAGGATELCPGCFATPATGTRCALCGQDPQAPRPVAALQPQVVLHGQFLVGRVLGMPGGFGITYLGLDLKLSTVVAIKEFLPRDFAMRAPDGIQVTPQSMNDEQLFRYGLGQFLEEARTLAKLNHPNIVRVRQFFEENGSAYLVMDYYHGLSLAEYLARQPGGKLPEQTALDLMLPILDGLDAVHAKGFLHRDIKPSNIYLARTDAGNVRPILLDFGAARSAVGSRSRSLSVVLSEGYAPFEQYHRKGEQGAWSDVYASAAVLYRSLTGEKPPSATERMSTDTLKAPSEHGISAELSKTLCEALSLEPSGRPQTALALKERLRQTATEGDSRRGTKTKGRNGPPPPIGAGDHSPENRKRLNRAYAAIIGPNSTAHYLERFQRFETQKPLQRIRWHWPVFFFSVLWFLYRKMWLAALVVFVVLLSLIGLVSEIAADFFFATDPQQETLANLVGILSASIILPMYAHAIYFDHARRQIERTAVAYPTAKAQIRALKARGGTKPLVVWLLTLVPAVLLALFVAVDLIDTNRLKGRISEALVAAEPYKDAVEQYALAAEEWPTSLRQLRLPGTVERGQQTLRIAVRAGGELEIGFVSAGQLQGATIQLDPYYDSGDFDWHCYSEDIRDFLLPPMCRQ